MHLTVFSSNDQLVNVEVDGDMTVDTLKAILEAECGVPSAQQALVVNNRILKDSETLASAGVKNGDVIQMMQPPPAGAPASRAPAGSAAPSSSRPAPPPAAPQAPAMTEGRVTEAEAQEFINAAHTNQQLLGNLLIQNQALHHHVIKRNVERVRDILQHVKDSTLNYQKQMAEQQALLEADPFDVEAQRKIEELIRQKNIEENYTSVMDEHPELFAHVFMLYINIEVNGVPVKAFVDTGAQITIVREDFAHECNIFRLLDKRFANKMVGVGSAMSLGRVHGAPTKVGKSFIACSYTVLSQKHGPKVIFGLDQLKAHACTIDLQKNSIYFPACNETLTFLGEAEIPKDDIAAGHKDDDEDDDGDAEMQQALQESAAGASGSKK